MKKILSVVALAVVVLATGAAPAHAEKARKLGEGDGVFRPVALAALPGVPLPDALTPEQRTYLGLDASGPFTIGAVRGDLVVVEFFNSSCYACALMAPVMDQAWRKVDARADLKDRVRFVGIGVGNTLEQVRDFHDRYDTPFPMIADPEFAAFDALGTVEGTPYLMLLRRGPDGDPRGPGAGRPHSAGGCRGGGDRGRAGGRPACRRDTARAGRQRLAHAQAAADRGRTRPRA